MDRLSGLRHLRPAYDTGRMNPWLRVAVPLVRAAIFLLALLVAPGTAWGIARTILIIVAANLAIDIALTRLYPRIEEPSLPPDQHRAMDEYERKPSEQNRLELEERVKQGE